MCLVYYEKRVDIACEQFVNVRSSHKLQIAKYMYPCLRMYAIKPCKVILKG